MGALDGQRIAVVGSETALGAAAIAAFEAEGAAVAVAHAGAHGDATGAVEWAIETLGGLDVLANLTHLAGPPTPSAGVTRDGWDRVFKATLRAARTSNQAAFRHMQAHGGGLVINHAHHTAGTGAPGQAMAAAAAQGIVALSNASAGAWFATGVRIVVVQPGGMSDIRASVVPTLVFLAGGAVALHGQTVPC